MNGKTCFRFVINNFSAKEALITSGTFVGGGCNWCIAVDPKGDNEYVTLYLHFANSELVPSGWKRSATFYFLALNQSNKELYRSPLKKLFSAEFPSSGCLNILPRIKFQESGFLEDDTLIIEVYIEDVEAFDGEEEEVADDINGFQVCPSKLTSLWKKFTEHTDSAEGIKPKSDAVKAAYLKVLINIVKDLEKPPESLSETKLSKARSELSELMDVGFKLDWLKLKLDKVSLEKKVLDLQQKKKEVLDIYGSRVQRLEGLARHLEVMKRDSFEIDSLKAKLGEVALERKIASDAYESRAKEQEERIKNLEMMVELNISTLKTQLDEVSLGRKKSDDAGESRAKQLEEHVKNLLVELGLKLCTLKTKLHEGYLERKKADDAAESRAKELEERVKNLELLDLDLKLDSLNKKFEDVCLERTKQLEERVIYLEEQGLKSRDKELDERIKNLELLELDFKLDSLNTKLEDVCLERTKRLEEHVMNLEEQGVKSRVQQLEENDKEIKLMLSNLKVEMDKKKDKSCDDGFLLVDEVV